MATPSPERLRAILRESPTIAVLGAHDEPARAAFYVPDYLHDRGYRIYPVNPTLDSEARGARSADGARTLHGERQPLSRRGAREMRS